MLDYFWCLAILPLCIGVAGGKALARRWPRHGRLLQVTCALVGITGHLWCVEIFMSRRWISDGITIGDRALIVLTVIVLSQLPFLLPTRSSEKDTRAVPAEELDDQRHQPAPHGSGSGRESAEIASLLHNTVGQGLTVIAMRAKQSTQDGLTPELKFIDQVAKRAMTDLRGVINRLHTSARHHGAGEAAESLIDVANYFRSAGLTIDFIATGSDQQLTAPLRALLIKVTREALTNALKHGIGGRVEIQLDIDREISLSIESRLTSMRFLRRTANVRRLLASRGVPQGGHGSRMLYHAVAEHGGRLFFGVSDKKFRVGVAFPLTTDTLKGGSFGGPSVPKARQVQSRQVDPA